MTMCSHACGNEARYINQNGELTCAICPLRRGEDSIRLIDVPSLLEWSRYVVSERDSLTYDSMHRLISDLSAIIGKDNRKASKP